MTDDEDDIPLLEITSIPALVPPRDTKESASLTAALQKMLYTFIAKPVMKARWVFIGKVFRLVDSVPGKQKLLASSFKLIWNCNG